MSRGLFFLQIRIIFKIAEIQLVFVLVCLDSDGHQSEQDGDGEQEKGQQQSFFEETSLHGLKYVKNAGAQRQLLSFLS